MTARTRPAVCGPRTTPVLALLATLTLLIALAGCGSSDRAAGGPDRPGTPTLTIGAIPDQDPQKLGRLYGVVAARLSALLGVPVVYQPVTDYTAAVSLFRTGDLQLVWFGGLTGVQARLQTPGAVPVAQRDIDADFHSLFLGHTDADLPEVDDVAGLGALRGTRFTYGSQSSTSGYLMPAHFLDAAGVDPVGGFDGEPGFSGSHDKTIDLVASGSYAAGAVNEQVWRARVAAGTVDTDRVEVLFRTPAYADYHWLLGPGAAERFGANFPARVSAALQGLNRADPADAEVLDLFGAERFVPTAPENYAEIERIGRRLGLVTGG